MKKLKKKLQLVYDDYEDNADVDVYPIEGKSLVVSKSYETRAVVEKGED